eukprot:328673-Amphidinium_carterae.2
MGKLARALSTRKLPDLPTHCGLRTGECSATQHGSTASSVVLSIGGESSIKSFQALALCLGLHAAPAKQS